MVNKVSLGGSHTNGRSIRYEEDVDVSDCHLFQDSSKTRAQPSVSCTRYDVGSGRKLGSLELYELPCSGNHATVEGNPVN